MSPSRHAPLRREAWYVHLDPAPAKPATGSAPSSTAPTAAAGPAPFKKPVPGIAGHEQGDPRPCIVVSDPALFGPKSGMAIVVPVTHADPRSPLHVKLRREDGLPLGEDLGLPPSIVKCEQVRSVSTERFEKFMSNISRETMREIDSALRDAMDL